MQHSLSYASQGQAGAHLHANGKTFAADPPSHAPAEASA